MVSAVLVVATPEHLEEVRTALEGHPWADVHHVEAESGRLVATVEASTTDEAQARLLELRSVPHVLLAEMVEHFVDDEPAD